MLRFALIIFGLTLFIACQEQGGVSGALLPAAGDNRYLVLEAADLDGDGDVDLAAGCLAMEPVPNDGRLERWVRNGLGAVVWENTRR